MRCHFGAEAAEVGRALNSLTLARLRRPAVAGHPGRDRGWSVLGGVGTTGRSLPRSFSWRQNHSVIRSKAWGIQITSKLKNEPNFQPNRIHSKDFKAFQRDSKQFKGFGKKILFVRTSSTLCSLAFSPTQPISPNQPLASKNKPKDDRSRPKKEING